MTDSGKFLDAWLARARARVAGTDLSPAAEEVGRLETLADGVAFVSGLPNARLDELLQFENGVMGFAQSLDTDMAACVLLDEGEGLKAGNVVRGTGTVVRVPVGEGLLGRIVDPLGRPVDNGGRIVASSYEPIEQPAPAIVDRDLVVEPVQTGTLVVDALFALGRGQRELVIGDRATGKTSLVVDCIINQKSSDIFCVYVAIGQKSSAVKRAIDAVRRLGAPERCIFVVAPASSAPGLQWIAPFAGFTMAEIFSRPRGGRAGRRRRSYQACRDASRARAVDAATAGARGLSRRCVLRSCPAARTRHAPVEGERRRLVDGAAYCRNGCRKFERLHPHKPHFHHRRPDRSRRQAVPGGAQARRRRRQKREPRGRQDPGAGFA